MEKAIGMRYILLLLTFSWLEVGFSNENMDGIDKRLGDITDMMRAITSDRCLSQTFSVARPKEYFTIT